MVESYLDRLAHPTLDRVAVRGVLDDVERANVGVHGYGSASFLRSLRDALEKLSERPATAAEKRLPTYRTLIAEQGLTPAATWMIGNSPASDIVSAQADGLGAVFIPNSHTWVLEHDEVPEDVLTLRRFTELVVHF